MRFKSLTFLILLSVWSMISAQTIPKSSFNYHHFFCKKESVGSHIQLKKKLKFKDFDLIKYYATKLDEEGTVSYNDTISNCLNHWCDSLKKNDPIFNFQVALVKKSDIGFLSVSKDLVYVYMGSVSQLESDKQLLSLLILIANNHDIYKSKLLSHVKCIRKENRTTDELVLSNKLSVNEILNLNNHLTSECILDTGFLTDSYTLDFEFSFLYLALNGARAFKYQDTNFRKDVLINIAKQTECMLLLNEGLYEKSIAHAVFTIPNSMLDFRYLVVAKNLYMLGYYHFYNQNYYIDMKNPFFLEEKIGDGIRFYNYATIYAWQMYKLNQKSTESETLLLNMIKLNEQAQNQSAQLFSIDFWEKCSDTVSYHEFIFFYNDIYKYQKLNKSQKLNSILFLNEISKASIMDAKNNVYKNSILIMPIKVTYMKSFVDSTLFIDYFKDEKKKYLHHYKKIEIPLQQFILKSNYQKAYTFNTLKLGHLDKFEYAYDDQNNSLLLKPNVNLIEDTVSKSMHLKYLIYIKMHIYPKHFKLDFFRKLINKFKRTSVEANQTMLIVDVYDIEAKKYIVACRRLIETKGSDLVKSNWYDIFKTILP
jgi:hypothetical protein